MRMTVSFIGLLMLPFVVGCEGNTPRRSPFAATSVPTAAKSVDFTPTSKNAVPGIRPVNPANQPGADVPAPAGNAPITIDGDKLETRRQLLNYHTAIFLRSEVGGLVASGIQENNNFVFRPAEGLDKLNVSKLMDSYRATKGKPPQTIKEFMVMLANNGEGVNLAELKPTEFYIYDPALAALESSKENMDYLQQYP